eukprot:TRINITY_DN3174_c0_g2_i1.p1 TRINITY_DN3174_c0_g2~~TRINITY_DN3174_c0_g2_i1.p1  ORF type:complete len:217 (-),score=23.19 TRINITY_DN3174_c0_g2_i1:56-706(-)
MKNSIKDCVRKKNYLEEAKLLITQYNTKPFCESPLPDNYLAELCEKDIDSAEFAYKFSVLGLPLTLGLKSNQRWVNISYIISIWHDYMNETKSLLQICSITKYFLIFANNSVNSCINNFFRSLKSNKAHSNGFFATGSYAAQLLYKELATPCYNGKYMPILAAKHPESLACAWAGLEMLKAGYEARSTPVKEIAILEAMPLGPMLTMKFNIGTKPF